MTDTPARPCKVGLILPEGELDMGGQTARWRDYATMAGVAEDIGVDSLWFVDHLIYRGEATEAAQQGVWECWSMLTGLAAITRRVELGSLVTPTSFRNPAVFAKMIDAVEEISSGRVILGLGAGWHEDEYRAFGLPYDRRVSRFEEAFTIIRCLLRDGVVDFEGTYYTARECELCPRGPRPNGPPLMIGSSGKRMLAIALPHVDSWNAWLCGGASSADEVPARRAHVDEACRAVGRDPAEVGRSVSIIVNLTDRSDIPKSMDPSSAQPLGGPPEEIAAGLRAFAGQGIDHLQIYLAPNTVRSIESFAPVLEAFDG
ncbi:MAG: LLM class flavin-dependent oxidoreductase [Gammaproteobacteria bacterium]|nr:LLM class flavin-dependent oxidoreductase [Gammaproteobacteria bacterium]